MKANLAKDKREKLLELRDCIEELKILIRICQDLKFLKVLNLMSLLLSR